MHTLFTKLLLHISNFLLSIYDYIYLFLKLYKVLCFAKLTLTQLPLYNTYEWPLSFIRVVTTPYFCFWLKFLPNYKIGRITIQLAPIVGLEFLASLIKLSYHLKLNLIAQLQKVNILIN